MLVCKMGGKLGIFSTAAAARAAEAAAVVNALVSSDRVDTAVAHSAECPAGSHCGQSGQVDVTGFCAVIRNCSILCQGKGHRKEP